VSAIEPIGPVEVRPKPVQRTTPVERTKRPAQRDPERDARERERRRRASEEPSDGHVDVRA
jgi:hypothetical protein